MTHPPLDWPAYRSTTLRHPLFEPLRVDPAKADPTELTGPAFGDGAVSPADNDLTVGPAGEAVGQRIVVSGRVLDGDGRPIPSTLVEIWQANASGRYRHRNDTWPGSLDPNFTGGGRTLTAPDGSYTFTTIRPGAYPWGNHPNAWRPAHIHFSVFGRSFRQRLVTQMYFPDDPLFFQDPIFNAVPGPDGRARLIAGYDHDVTQPEWALAFTFDIVLGVTPSQTVGPFLHLVLAEPGARLAIADGQPGGFEVGGIVLDGAGAPVPDAVIETWQADGRFGRCPTDDEGRWSIRTAKPPSVATPDGTAQAPHLLVSVFARGLLDRVVTRIYFADEAAANATDPTLGVVAAEHRQRLVAAGDPAAGYRFDIRLQGDDESVFFAV